MAKEDIILDLLQDEENISDEQLAMLDGDDDMVCILRDATALRGEMRNRLIDDDTERQLAQFHKRHGKGDTRRRAMRIAMAVVSAAAVVLVAFVLWPARKTANLPANAIVVYQAEKPERGEVKITVGDRVQAVSDTAARQDAVLTDTYRQAQTELVVVSVPSGETYDVTLPDGTVAYLHQNSSLMFPSRFGGGSRNVTLEGEAYFNVHKDSSHPFIIKTDNAQVRVLGTELNVSAYKRQDVTVTLITGSAAVVADEVEQRLVPGEQIVLAGGEARRSMVDLQPFTNWRDGFFYYDNMTLEEVLRQIGKAYNYSVAFCNRDAMSLRVRFIAERSKSINEIIKTINDLEKVTVELKDDVILVR